MPKGVVGCGQLPCCPVRRPASARQTQEVGIGREGVLPVCLSESWGSRPGQARQGKGTDTHRSWDESCARDPRNPHSAQNKWAAAPTQTSQHTHTFPPNSLRRNSAMSAYRTLQCTPSPAPEILAISKFTLSRWCRLLHERTCGCSSIGPGQKQGCAHFRLPPPASSSCGRAGWPGRRLRTYWG